MAEKQLNEKELRKLLEVMDTYRNDFVKWKDNRLQITSNLQEIIDALEKVRHQRNISGVSGSVAGVVGGILTGAGILTMPFTVGATAPLIAAGVGFMVAGTTTSLAGGLADHVKSKALCSTATELLTKDQQLTSNLFESARKFAQFHQQLELVIQRFSVAPASFKEVRKEDGGQSVKSLVGVGSITSNITTMAKVLKGIAESSMTSEKLLSIINPISSVINSTDDAIGVGAKLGGITIKGSKVGLAASGIMCVLALAVEVTTLIHFSKRVQVFNKTKLAELKKQNFDGNICFQETLEDLHIMLHSEYINAIKEIEDLQNKLENMTFIDQIHHSFTKQYVSERAHKFKLYLKKLKAELRLMENIPLHRKFSKK